MSLLTSDRAVWNAIKKEICCCLRQKRISSVKKKCNQSDNMILLKVESHSFTLQKQNRITRYLYGLITILNEQMHFKDATLCSQTKQTLLLCICYS